MRERQSRNRVGEDGVALILSVLVLLLAGTLVLRTLAHSGRSTDPAARSRAALHSLFAADAGVLRALEQIAEDPPVLAPINLLLEDGTSVQSRTRADLAPRPLLRLGVVAPPDGYQINVGSEYVNRLFRVHITAEAPVGATTELEADLVRLEVGEGLGPPHGLMPRTPWNFADPDRGEFRSEPVFARLKLRGPPGTGDRCGLPDADGDCREEWVAIFGGGYDSASDPNHAAFVADRDHPRWSPRAKALYAVSLATGKILAKVGPDSAASAAMRFAFPGAAAVVDLDFDGFADVAYIGDLGGQIWKWDLHAVGDDRGADGQVDGWPASVFFRAEPADLGGGIGAAAAPRPWYRSFYSRPSASFRGGELHLVFGSGNRDRLAYPRKPGFDENTRIYVVRDPHPGPAFDSATGHRPVSEADLSDVSRVGAIPRRSGDGFFIVAEDGEQLVGAPIVFAGRAIVASLSPACGSAACAEAGGRGFLYAFDLGSGDGFFSGGRRRIALGPGLPGGAEVRIGGDPDGDRIRIAMSTGRIFSLTAPSRRRDARSIVRWRQRF